MFTKVAFISFLFSSVLGFNFFQGSRIYSQPVVKEVTQEITKVSKDSFKAAFENSRKRPKEQQIPQKNTCPPIDAPVMDDSEYKKCETAKNQSAISPHPDQHKTTTQILETYGYSHAEYKVKTEDGYILRVFRITGSPKLNTSEAHKTPIYVNHGIASASDFWFFLAPEKNMVLMMADEGYDVWLSNARGSYYSLEHETLNYNKDWESYWEFSFHEMGIYDVPAVTNLILKESKRTSIIYVGFSMATTQILISLSELPEMNKKIKAAFLLAPIAYMGHSPSITRNIAIAGDTEEMYRLVNVGLRGRVRNNQDYKKMMALSGADFCATSAAKCGLCDNVLFAFNGVNPPQLNRSSLPFLLEKSPDSESYKVFVHFGQMMTSCRFQKFEYTPSVNLKKYGSLRPPLYNLRNVRTPLYLYHAEQDLFGIPLDVNETVRRLAKGVVQKVTLVPDRLFTHYDFIMAKDADKLVYRTVLDHMKIHIENI